MFHDPWFYLFTVETLGLVSFGVWLGHALAKLRATSKPPAKSPPAPGSLRERMQQPSTQNTALQTTQSMGTEVKNGWVLPPSIVGRWRGYLESLPASAYGDNPQRSKERYIERISELQTGIIEALQANDLEVLRNKALVQPKDWIGIRVPESAQVLEDHALLPPPEN